MSYDHTDASRISNEIAAQGEYTRRQNENITYEERIFQLDMAMAKEKDPNILNELNNLRTQVIDEYEDVLKERKRQKNHQYYPWYSISYRSIHRPNTNNHKLHQKRT